MKELSFNEMEVLEGGDCDTHMGFAIGMMALGIAAGPTPVGVAFFLGGAIWGYTAKNTACVQ